MRYGWLFPILARIFGKKVVTRDADYSGYTMTAYHWRGGILIAKFERSMVFRPMPDQQRAFTKGMFDNLTDRKKDDHAHE